VARLALGPQVRRVYLDRRCPWPSQGLPGHRWTFRRHGPQISRWAPPKKPRARCSPTWSRVTPPGALWCISSTSRWNARRAWHGPLVGANMQRRLLMRPGRRWSRPWPVDAPTMQGFRILGMASRPRCDTDDRQLSPFGCQRGRVLTAEPGSLRTRWWTSRALGFGLWPG